MKVYNHKDAYDHLKYIFQFQKEDSFIAIFTECAVHYGKDSGFNIDKAIHLNMPAYDLQRRGGAIVTCPGDVVYCFFLKENIPSLNAEIRKFLVEKIRPRVDSIESVDNDILINGKKCFGFMQTQVGKMHFIGGHISINCNEELIKEVCTKNTNKNPGGLSEHGFTTNDVVSWLNEFWFYYK